MSPNANEDSGSPHENVNNPTVQFDPESSGDRGDFGSGGRRFFDRRDQFDYDDFDRRRGYVNEGERGDIPGEGSFGSYRGTYGRHFGSFGPVGGRGKEDYYGHGRSDSRGNRHGRSQSPFRSGFDGRGRDGSFDYDSNFNRYGSRRDQGGIYDKSFYGRNDYMDGSGRYGSGGSYGRFDYGNDAGRYGYGQGRFYGRDQMDDYGRSRYDNYGRVNRRSYEGYGSGYDRDGYSPYGYDKDFKYGYGDDYGRYGFGRGSNYGGFGRYGYERDNDYNRYSHIGDYGRYGRYGYESSYPWGYGSFGSGNRLGRWGYDRRDGDHFNRYDQYYDYVGNYGPRDSQYGRYGSWNGPYDGEYEGRGFRDGHGPYGYGYNQGMRRNPYGYESFGGRYFEDHPDRSPNYRSHHRRSSSRFYN